MHVYVHRSKAILFCLSMSNGHFRKISKRSNDLEKEFLACHSTKKGFSKETGATKFLDLLTVVVLSALYLDKVVKIIRY